MNPINITGYLSFRRWQARVSSRGWAKEIYCQYKRKKIYTKSFSDSMLYDGYLIIRAMTPYMRFHCLGCD